MLHAKMKHWYLILIVFYLIGSALNAHSQEVNIGFRTGFITQYLFTDPEDLNFSFEITGEFVPKKAMISFTQGIQYFPKANIIFLPLALNLNPGKRFKFNLKGGLLPVVRLAREKPDKTIEFGGFVGIGASFEINKKIEVFADIIGFYFVPHYYTHYDHFGGSSTVREIDKLEYFNIGIKYKICRRN
jgi:hypothetical protein